MSVKVKLSDGRTIDVFDLDSIIPFTCIFYGKKFTEYCREYAYKFSNEDLNKLYLNLLVLKSKKLKYKYALRYIHEVGMVNEKEFLRVDNLMQFDGDKLLDGISNHKLLLKYVIHKIYRILNTRFTKKKIIRSWIDVTERLFDIYDGDVTLFLYPFSLNYIRLMKYYIKLYKEGVDFRFIGLSYNLMNLIRCYISKTDYEKLKFEYDAYLNHVDDFCGAEFVYTSDDIEPGAFLLNNKLRKSNKKVFNKAHGVGTYSPIVSYDSFTLYNEKQKEFYANLSDISNYYYFKRKVIKKYITGLSKRKIVFLDQGEFGDSYEGKLQKKIYSILNNISKRNIYLKPHPNRSLKSKKRLFFDYPNLDEYTGKGENEFYMHMYSTSYYDFEAGNADFLFIHDDLFDPEVIFGKKINKVHVSCLKKFISDET